MLRDIHTLHLAVIERVYDTTRRVICMNNCETELDP